MGADVSHDPLCEWSSWRPTLTPCKQCDLIARVRADERAAVDGEATSLRARVRELEDHIDLVEWETKAGCDDEGHMATWEVAALRERIAADIEAAEVPKWTVGGGYRNAQANGLRQAASIPGVQ